MLVEQGQEILEDHLILLRLEHDVANAQLTVGAKARRIGSAIVLVAALFALIGYYVQRHEPEIAGDLSRITALAPLIVVAIGPVRLLALQPWDAELIPIAISAMVLVVLQSHFGSWSPSGCVS